MQTTIAKKIGVLLRCVHAELLAAARELELGMTRADFLCNLTYLPSCTRLVDRLLGVPDVRWDRHSVTITGIH